MIPKKRRVKKDEIPLIFKIGRSYHSPLFLVKVVKDGLKSEFGVVIASKTARNAIERNLWKRRIKSIIRQEIVRIKPGFKVLVFLKKRPELEFKYLKEELSGLLQQSGLLT